MEKTEFNEFFCPLCKKKYDDNVYLPRMLPECGHTFCSLCLKLLLNDSDQGLTCPDDNIVYHNKKSILGFPKNFALLQIIEKQKLSNKTTSNSISDIQSPVSMPKTKSSIHNYNRIKEELANINNANNLSSNFSKNFAEKNYFPKENDKLCPIHMKKMDLFCLEDNERICTNCALFGDHKNHEIDEEEEILKSINVRAEKLLEILEKIEVYDEKQIGSLIQLSKIFENCLIKRSNITSLIQDKFSEIVKILTKAQNNLLNKINDYFNKLQTALGCLNKIPISDIMVGLDAWKSDVKNKLMILSQKTEKDEICSEILVDKFKGGSDLINEGNKLVKRLEKLNEIPLVAFIQSVDDVKLNFNDILIKTIESNLYYISLPNIWETLNIDVLFNELIESSEEIQYKKDNLSISEVCQDKKSPLFVDLKSPNSINYLPKSPCKINQRYIVDGYLSLNQNDVSYDSVKTLKKNLSSNVNINESIQKESHSNYYPLVKMTKNRKSTEDGSGLRPTSCSNMKKMEEIKHFDMEEASTPQIKSLKKRSGFEKNIMKKQSLVSKLKIPEKYRVIFDDLKNDKLEQVDLSNAELGDKVISHLADLIADSKNLKSLKLKKNKISDEGFAILIEAFRKNESIRLMNFENNLLAEKSIDSFCKMILNKKNGIVIKKVSFLNNNINTAKCKSYVKEAKTNDVDLYI